MVMMMMMTMNMQYVGERRNTTTPNGKTTKGSNCEIGNNKGRGK